MKFPFSLSGAYVGRLALVAALTTGVLGTIAGHGTLAYFTTQVKSDTNEFSAGTLHFRIDDYRNSPSGNDGLISTSMTLDNIKPGDVIYAPLTITNNGSLESKWGIKYSTTTTGTVGNLAPALKLGIVGSGTGTGANATCEPTDYATSGVWNEIVRTPTLMQSTGETIVDVNSTTPPGADGVYAPADVTAGAFLPLAHNSSDKLCVRIEFPSTSDNTFNGADATATDYNTTLTFTFDGTQRVLSTNNVI